MKIICCWQSWHRTLHDYSNYIHWKWWWNPNQAYFYAYIFTRKFGTLLTPTFGLRALQALNGAFRFEWKPIGPVEGPLALHVCSLGPPVLKLKSDQIATMYNLWNPNHIYFKAYCKQCTIQRNKILSVGEYYKLIDILLAILASLK